MRLPAQTTVLKRPQTKIPALAGIFKLVKTMSSLIMLACQLVTERIQLLQRLVANLDPSTPLGMGQ